MLAGREGSSDVNQTVPEALARKDESGGEVETEMGRSGVDNCVDTVD